MNPQDQNISSGGLFAIDRSMVNLKKGEENTLRKGWQGGRGTIMADIIKTGSVQLSKDVRNKVDVAAIFEPFAWFWREHGKNNQADDTTFVFRNICDDRHASHTKHDRSVQIVRLSDLEKGLLSDELIVRAIDLSPPPAPSPWIKDPLGLTVVKAPEPPETPGIPERVAMKQLGQFGALEFVDHLYLGPRDLDRKDRTYNKLKPPGGGLIGRMCDIVIITEDDSIRTTADGDGDSYANIRHDAHFHMSENKDGRIYFTPTEPGVLPFGKSIKGEMINDPELADQNTALERESGQWRPQIKIPEEYGSPWTTPEGKPEPKPYPGTYTPDSGPVKPTGEGLPGGIAIDIPPSYTPPKTSKLCFGFVDGENLGFAKESYVLPMLGIDEDAVPLSFRGTFIVPIPAGEILAANNAVFRFTVDIIRNGGVADKPTYVRHGRMDVAIPATHDPSVVAVVDLAFDARQFEAGDMMQLSVWRDWNDAKDTAGYIVYMKDIAPLVGETITEGHVWNFFMENPTETAIVYPMIA